MDINVKSVKNFYNQAGIYFSKTRVWPWKETEIFLSKLKNNDRVLDLGCGNGRLIKGIKAKIKYTGIDFSDTLIKEAKAQHKSKNSNFKTCDITQESTYNNLGKFDAIFCIAALHHLPLQEQLKVLKQIKIHLAKNGFAIITWWNLWQVKYLKHHFSFRSLMLKFKNWRYLYFPFQNKYDRFCVAMTLSDIKSLCDDAGIYNFEVSYSGKSNRNIVLVIKKIQNLTSS